MFEEFVIDNFEITAQETQYDYYFNELYAPDGHIGFEDIDSISCYFDEEGGGTN